MAIEFRKIVTAFAGIILLLALFSAVQPIHATNCTFTTVGTTMELDEDCTTDVTILIPNGFTLDGNGHTITAVDPEGNHFVGAVVKNQGETAHVKNLRVKVMNLADTCDDGVARLRGIMFEGASGSITNNVVMDINQGNSGCQEGNAIEVRNEPFDGTHPSTKTVMISGNTVTKYQKTGILANGDVYVIVTDNRGLLPNWRWHMVLP
ncbi:MAG: hypothetical protein QXU32_11185 [Nitrososphaerales archaeon]